MAKRKNPLKSLDDFLKQEATSFVTPETITAPAENARAAEERESPKTKEATKEDILLSLQALANKENGDFRTSFYNIIRETLEKLEHGTAEDKMLINTVLYLKDKAGWKDNIREYWDGDSVIR